MSEVEVEVTSSITRWRRAAERVTARERWPARPSSPASAVSYRLLVPSTPKASTSKASTLKASTPKASTPKAWGCATSAQLPKCLPNVLQLGGG